MTDYFHEMGWNELQEGERPDHFLHLARLLIDHNIYESSVVAWPRLPPPASKTVIANLKEVTLDRDDKSCPICLTKFDLNGIATEMPCGHLYHQKCLFTWLEKTNSCPTCRHELPTDSELYESFKKEKKRIEERKKDLEILHNSMFS